MSKKTTDQIGTVCLCLRVSKTVINVWVTARSLNDFHNAKIVACIPDNVYLTQFPSGIDFLSKFSRTERFKYLADILGINLNTIERVGHEISTGIPEINVVPDGWKDKPALFESLIPVGWKIFKYMLNIGFIEESS